MFGLPRVWFALTARIPTFRHTSTPPPLLSLPLVLSPFKLWLLPPCELCMATSSLWTHLLLQLFFLHVCVLVVVGKCVKSRVGWGVWMIGWMCLRLFVLNRHWHRFSPAFSLSLSHGASQRFYAHLLWHAMLVDFRDDSVDHLLKIYSPGWQHRFIETFSTETKLYSSMHGFNVGLNRRVVLYCHCDNSNKSLPQGKE